MNMENSPFNIDRLLNVEMDVIVRFGLTEMPLQDIVNFGNGSMIELNRTVDDPVELLVNNLPFAQGEVVVVDGYYSIKITKLHSQNGGLNGLNGNSDTSKENEQDATVNPQTKQNVAEQTDKPAQPQPKADEQKPKQQNPDQDKNPSPKPKAPEANAPKEEN